MTEEEEAAGVSGNDDDNDDDGHDNDMMKMTTLPLPQTWRTMSAAAINRYTQ